MSSKRRSGASPNFNFRPQTESQKWETRGTKPLPKPVSVVEALLTMIIHICRKILFVDTKLKIGLYAAGLFLSFIVDVYPFPKTYFSRSDNMFNQYFVKLGWAWTLAVTVPFVALTSFTLCCGKRPLVLKHLSRLAVATAMWFVFTKSFAYIEQNFGRCSLKAFSTKQACLSRGAFWHSLDISGHAFILIYSTMVIIEEGRAIIGWDTIMNLIQNEEHNRMNGEEDLASPLKHLSDDEFLILKSSYNKFLPYIRATFIAMTVLACIWDIMILSTILYFHIMIEKFISGCLAVLVWFLCYRVWYSLPDKDPPIPGDGLFKYNKTTKKQKEIIKNRGPAGSVPSPRAGDLPKFMGMPLYGLRTMEPKEEQDDVPNNTDTDQPSLRLSGGFNSTRIRGSQQQAVINKSGMTTRSQVRNNGNVTI